MELSKLFREKYDKIFDKDKILVDFERNAEIYDYLVMWRTHRTIVKVRKQIAKNIKTFFRNTVLHTSRYL